MTVEPRARLEAFARLARAVGAVDGPVPPPTAVGRTPGGRRVAVLVLASALPEFDEGIRAIRSTWGRSRVPGVDVRYLYGNLVDADRYGLVDLRPWTGVEVPDVPDGQVWASADVLVAGCADVIWVQPDALLRKRLAALAHVVALQRYDVVATVCATSYVDLARLADHVDRLPDHGVYEGPLGVCAESGRPYVSGSCIVMTIDVAEQLAAHRRQILVENAGAYADDVALAGWVARHVSDRDPASIASAIEEGRPATGDATFVSLAGSASLDVRSAAGPGRPPTARPGAFHYHLARDRVADMAELHRVVTGAVEE